jgi:hypothetical protein
LDEYGRLVRKLRLPILDNPQLFEPLSICFLRWMVENKLPIYRYKDVTRFLLKECHRQTQKNIRRARKEGTTWNAVRHEWYLINRYTKPIPLPVLQLAEKVVDRFGHGLGIELYVSDYRAVRPDPFLAVFCKEGSGLSQETFRYVIAHWDEPNFHGKPIPVLR